MIALESLKSFPPKPLELEPDIRIFLNAKFKGQSFVASDPRLLFPAKLQRERLGSE